MKLKTTTQKTFHGTILMNSEFSAPFSDHVMLKDDMNIVKLIVKLIMGTA